MSVHGSRPHILQSEQDDARQHRLAGCQQIAKIQVVGKDNTALCPGLGQNVGIRLHEKPSTLSCCRTGLAERTVKPLSSYNAKKDKAKLPPKVAMAGNRYLIPNSHRLYNRIVTCAHRNRRPNSAGN